MTLDQLPAGVRVLVDSNVLVYHFQPHPVLGPTCNHLMERIERQDIEGLTFASLLSEVAHRLMLIEAATVPGWGRGKVLNRLKQHPTAIQRLTLYQTAVEAVLQSRLVVMSVSGPLVSTAAALSRQYSLLTNDALTVAIMQQRGLANLASADSDFDRVPGITRYAPA
jgi:predicted nucleic acid-binding protein